MISDMIEMICFQWLWYLEKKGEIKIKEKDISWFIKKKHTNVL